MKKKIEVIPGILEKDFPAIKRKIEKVAPFVSWVQIDITDNTLVPNRTFLEFVYFKTLKTKINFEAHLMVTNPLPYLSKLKESGFKRVIAHLEGKNIKEFLKIAEKENLEKGLALNTKTSFERIIPYFPQIDCVLVMTVPAGQSGQKFAQENLRKVKMIRKLNKFLTVEVDGGINNLTAKLAVSAGADRLVSNTFLFSQKGIGRAIDELKDHGN